MLYKDKTKNHPLVLSFQPTRLFKPMRARKSHLAPAACFPFQKKSASSLPEFLLNILKGKRREGQQTIARFNAWLHNLLAMYILTSCPRKTETGQCSWPTISADLVPMFLPTSMENMWEWGTCICAQHVQTFFYHYYISNTVCSDYLPGIHIMLCISSNLELPKVFIRICIGCM